MKKSQPVRRHGHVPQQPLLDSLSERELDVLYLLARGASNQEIAQELEVALNTVKHHMSSIISKLGASNRTQAVAQARALGLLLISAEETKGSHGDGPLLTYRH